MSTKTSLSVYCIANVSSPPISLNRRAETGAFYCHLAVPVQDNLVIFCEGEWEQDGEYTVTLTYKDDEMELGKVTNTARCLYWSASGKVIPDSMKSEAENGLAKLLLERCEVPVSVESMDEMTTKDYKSLKEVNENTPQITEEGESTPDRPQKKRRTSLNKDNITPNGPASKKQKMQKLPTRTRTPKTENNDQENISAKKDKKSAKSNSPSVTDNKDQENTTTNFFTKNDNKLAKSNSPSVTENKDQGNITTKKDKKSAKSNSPSVTEKKSPLESKEEKNNVSGQSKRKSIENSPLYALLTKKMEKVTESSPVVGDCDKTMEQEEDAITTTPKVGKNNKGKNNKQTPKLSTDENEKSSDGEKEKSEKKGRRKSEAKKNDKVLEDKDVNVKRKRKSRSDTLEDSENGKDSSMDVEHRLACSDKENVHTDSNVLKTEKELKSNAQKPAGKKDKEVMISKTGKIATCKDLTLRALERPTGRWGHSLCFVNKNMAVLIGGQGEKQQISKDSVWTLDCETRRWKDPTTEAEGQKPEYRMGHTATYDPLVRCIYVFGGSKNTRWFHDVHMLDVEEWKWQLVKVNGKAPTRAYHSATLYRHELWIFGGVYPRTDPQPDGCSNEVNIFSPVMASWYQPIVSGDKPIPRSGHSATLINDQLVIFGGWDAPISYNDLHILDMSIVEWSQPKVTGTPPSPRSWHASCALSGNRLLIHGGYNGDIALEDTFVFDLDQLTWNTIFVENQPSARVGHKALCMPYRHDNEEEDEVIIFGGGDNDGAYFDDLYSIYVPFNPATVL